MTRALTHPAIRLLGLLAATPDDPGACWTTTATGTPRPKVGAGGRAGGTMRSARVALEAKLGRPLAADMQALHHCDNPACIRPDHLFEGTQADNLADMRAKGRGPRGERHGIAKLTDAQADEVRVLMVAGWVQADIAAAYGVSQPLVSMIGHGRLRAVAAP